MCLDSDLTDIQLEADLLVHQSRHDEIHDFCARAWSARRIAPPIDAELPLASDWPGCDYRVTNRSDDYLVIERLG